MWPLPERTQLILESSSDAGSRMLGQMGEEGLSKVLPESLLRWDWSQGSLEAERREEVTEEENCGEREGLLETSSRESQALR